MNIRADLDQPACVVPADWTWSESPQKGVSRVMLDRVGGEVAVATSFVRFEPDSRFPEHDHALGEEFIVLEGEFADEAGRYPVGSYLRNPPGSHHSPFSNPGCLIWVKLRQFDEADQRQCVLSLDTAVPDQGVVFERLHEHSEEDVTEIVAAAGEDVDLPAKSEVQEVLVLEGQLSAPDGKLPRWSWVRIPAGQGWSGRVESPCRLFLKTRPQYREPQSRQTRVI